MIAGRQGSNSVDTVSVVGKVRYGNMEYVCVTIVMHDRVAAMPKGVPDGVREPRTRAKADVAVYGARGASGASSRRRGGSVNNVQPTGVHDEGVIGGGRPANYFYAAARLPPEYPPIRHK